MITVEQKDDTPKLVPRLVEKTDQHLIGNNNFQPKAGEYHLVSLNQFGNEIEGSDFSASSKLYDKYYKNNPKFLLKKNPH